MDSKRCIVSFVAVGLLMAVSGARAQHDSLDAVIHVLGSRSGLAVFIDGKAAGSTPLFGYRLPSGKHRITVSASDSLLWASQPWVAEANCTAHRGTRIVAEVQHVLWLTSNPPGAALWQGDRHLGWTPLQVESGQWPLTSLVLKKRGYADQPVFADASRHHLHVELKPHVKLPLKGMRQSRLNKRRTLAGGAVSLLLGAAGYVMKDRADKAYAAYRRTGHPGRMEKHFSRAQSYDHWSSALYLAGEAALGVTLYLTIKDFWR